MISIVKKGPAATIQWELGSSAPSVHHDDIDVMYIRGEALELVRQKFSHVPTMQGDQMVYTGDMAKFLFLNLKEIRFKHMPE